MPKGMVASARDGLAEAAAAITAAMTAPDAGPMMPALQQLHGILVGLIQQGHMAGAPGGQPGMGQPGMGQGPPGGQGFPQRPPGMPGPPPNQMPNAGGQGVFPTAPQPNPNELRALLAQKAGV